MLKKALTQKELSALLGMTTFEIYKKLYPVVNMTERYPAPTQAVKHILSEVIGFDEGICRRPRREISDEDKKLVVEWSQIKELAKTNKM